MLYNVFLDFFNRDSREIYGLYRLPKETHLAFLTEALTVAVFLCRDHCILPPGFLAECSLCREVLTGRRAEYFDDRLVRLAMKEYSFDDFWGKKERLYQPFRQKYKGLFDPKNHRILRGVSHAIIPRSVNIADAILTGWEEAPDSNRVWRQGLGSVSAAATERIRRIPREVLNDGSAVTWPAIRQRISDPVDVPNFRHVLQNVYFSSYLTEYKLKVITSLPYMSHAFVSLGNNLSYDYDALRYALAALGLWDFVRGLSARSIIDLRKTLGYIRFRDAFETITRKTGRVDDVRRIFTLAAKERRPAATFLSVVKRNSLSAVPLHGIVVSEPETDEIADQLGAVGAMALEVAQSLTAGDSEYAPRRGGKVNRTKPEKKIAIFVALEEERVFFVDQWSLSAKGVEQVWRGHRNGVHFSVFGRDEMGRVPAAVATMEFLSKETPDILLIAGIAGGFPSEEVSLGDVLIATSVVDLASRKIHRDTRTIPAFRPREFPIDDRLAKYLRARLNLSDWESRVIKAAEWPASRRPAIRYGPLVSLDEVVASSDFAEKLCEYWPKLLGIEMEAGGVCAAADTFHMKAAVIRGVSDLADPSKSDTEWRRRAIKTVANLIENIDFDALLA